MKLNTKGLKVIIPIVGFLILASIYFGPLFTGKILVQSDNVQLTGINKELSEFREKGEPVYWNAREFSGRPVIGTSEYNPFRFMSKIFITDSVLPKPVMMTFLLFFGMFILLRVMKVSNWISAIGAMGYAFASFNLISIEVGHDNKVLAMAFMAPVLAGVILAYRGELLKGMLLTMISSGFQLLFGHIQITYYLLLMVLGYLILVIIDTAKNKTWVQFFKASGVLVVATLIGFGCNFTKLYATLEYADYSNRGGTDLKGDSGQVSQTGLDKDYALSWSSGKMETFTLIFPYFHGGASSEKLDKDSDTYKALQGNGVPAQNINSFVQNTPLYWGNQPFTGGPIYFGAIMCFLFILSFFVLDGPIRWWGLALSVLSILLAMGKNLEWFTDIFFYYFPLYNKFRSVTMIFAIAQLIVPMLGFMTLDKIISEKVPHKNFDTDLLKIAGGVIGLGIFFLLFKGAFFDFQGQNDNAYGFPLWLQTAIESDRKSLYNWSILRSVIFIALTAGGLWLYVKKIVKPTYLIAGLALIVLIDMWGVDKKYLGADDFASKRQINQQQFTPTQADQQILQDKSYYRVLNLAAQNPFSDGLTSYHHYSILGYNAIKMQRYQELIDRYIRNMNEGVLNMLNTKYIIGKGQKGPVVQQNRNAFGNTWLVKSLDKVSSADEEIERIGEDNLRDEAVIDQKFVSSDLKLNYSGIGSIELDSYHPEDLKYSFESSEQQFVVFSEIYYAPGWNAYIDGQKVEHVRVDYVLRGLQVPTGSHEVEFKYEPVSTVVGSKVVLGSTGLMLLIILAYVFLNLKSQSTIRTSEEE